eukprot:CAMPEP_0172468228 /NCGR_PEP_ID=MMETSP1065-20121228/60866_1 /TAXON_ID=265537 /ORGANISM="Amphiprora paludosa, Strain CCMP125" /LENGTH=150 /DNA_ID=CAMNT_0013225581 /DNA_START=46 /DNA_END=498 /DNA_ORIENTATION=-
MTKVTKPKRGLLGDPSVATKVGVATLLGVILLVLISWPGGEERRRLRAKSHGHHHHHHGIEGVVSYASAPQESAGTLSQQFEDHLHEDPLALYNGFDSESGSGSSSESGSEDDGDDDDDDDDDNDGEEEEGSKDAVENKDEPTGDETAAI